MTRQPLWISIKDLSVLPHSTKELLALVSLKTRGRRSIWRPLKQSKIFHLSCIKSGKLSTRMGLVLFIYLQRNPRLLSVFSIFRSLMKRWRINLSRLREGLTQNKPFKLKFCRSILKELTPLTVKLMIQSWREPKSILQIRASLLVWSKPSKESIKL